MSTKNGEIGARLASWGKELVGPERGWQARLAAKLGVSVSYLQAYTSGRNRPGNVVQAKLRKLGADVEWIMTGVSATDGAEQRRRDDAKRERTRVYFWAPDGVSDETRKIYERLAEIISKVPPEDADKIEAIVKAYMKSVLKGKKDS